MTGAELLDKMELIDSEYIEEADTAVNQKTQKKAYIRGYRALIPVCACIALAVFAAWSAFNELGFDVQPPQVHLSKNTTAKIFYGYQEEAADPPVDQMSDLTDKEIFAQEDLYIFRGHVIGTSGITVDFNGRKIVCCRAWIIIDQVYKGDLSAGDEIVMLFPGEADLGRNTDRTDVGSYFACGSEGIFMPTIYDEASCWEYNGAKIMLQDLASCGLADNMRWMFLSTEDGIVFDRDTHPGAGNATTLDDIGVYVTEMID